MRCNACRIVRPRPVSDWQCQVTFDVEEDMKSPVYVYYELRKFYQNHRTYVKSRSHDQLAGGVSVLPLGRYDKR